MPVCAMAGSTCITELMSAAVWVCWGCMESIRTTPATSEG